MEACWVLFLGEERVGRWREGGFSCPRRCKLFQEIGGSLCSRSLLAVS